MKKLIFTTALIIFATAFASANSPSRVLTFKDSFGKILTLTVMEEKEKEETLPFDHEAVFAKAHSEIINQVFDVSILIKPEKEVDDIPAELKDLIQARK
jgi:hypothetical protein